MRGKARPAVCAAGVLILLTTLLAAGPARACSFPLLDPRDIYHETDAAFIGTLIEKEAVGDYYADFTFDVEEVFKGDLGDAVVVRSSSSGAMCGIGGEIGSRLSLFLRSEEEGSWSSDLGLQWSEETMREVTAPFPEPDGRGEAKLLLGGSFGETRVLALDKAGRILGYGYGDGDVEQLSVCPGSETAVEYVEDGGNRWIAIRRLSDLAVLREVDVAGGLLVDLECTESDGNGTLVALLKRNDTYKVHELHGERWEAVLDTPRRVKDLRSGEALVAGRRRVFRHDLETGTVKKVAGFTLRISDVRWSPDGKYIAGGAFPRYGEDRKPIVFVRGPEGLSHRRSKRPFPVRWAGDRKFVAGSLVLDRQLEVRGHLGEQYFLDGTGFGRWFYRLQPALTRQGQVIRHDLEGELPERTVAFFTQIVWTIEAIPEGIAVDAPPHS